jgi:DNA polymerase III subunit delta
MQLRVELRSANLLQKTLESATAKSIWAISGDDPLLVGETADQIRRHFKESGITEREVEVPDRSFDWKGWLAASGTGSLFSEQRLMDLRLPTGKPGIEGSKAIQAWCANPPADVTLLVTLPRADRTLQNASWFKALDDAGTILIVPELYRSDMASWISQRLRAKGLSATPDAIAWMCDQFEGNLIAANQEILKLALHHENRSEPMDVHEIKTMVADVARFSPFSLGEALLSGETSRALRIVRGLQAEAEPLPLILWSVSEDLRMLARTQRLMESGRSIEQAMREARIPRHKERPIAVACRKTNSSRTWRALRQAAEVDTIIKGLKLDDPWVALERMALDFAQS